MRGLARVHMTVRYSASAAGWLSAIRWPPGSTSRGMPSLSSATVRWNSTGKNRSSAPAATRIGTAGQDGKVTDRLEHGVGFGPLLILPGCRYVRRHVVEEVDGQVEFGRIAVSSRGGYPGPFPPGVVPPCPGGLTGLRDHGVHQDEGAYRLFRRGERRSETAKRLRHQHDVAPVTDRVRNQRGVLGQPGCRVIAWQVDGDRMVPRPL